MNEQRYKLMIIIEDMDTVDPVDFPPKLVSEFESMESLRQFVKDHPIGYSHYFAVDSDDKSVSIK